jgi:hypothetical protein
MIPLPYIISAIIGAGAMFVVTVQPLPQEACEPIELVRFVGNQPEIHVIEQTTFGRGSDDWLQQFTQETNADPETVAEDDPAPRRRHHWRRRHGRY